jgi:C4-dicarboxylate-specific signal transduction histidine kinase
MEAKKAAFMGKITAGITHEMKNVLAIIKESAGLLDDLISFTKENSPPPRDKMLRTITRITEQVNRGVDLATKLNSFAHTTDNGVTTLDLNQILEQAVFLCQRFARLKKMTLNIVSHGAPIIVTADPLSLQMLLFQCVEKLMDSVQAGSAITLQSRGDDRKVIIAASEDDAQKGGNCTEPPFEDSSWEAIKAYASSLNLSVETGCAPRWISVNF